MGGSRFEFLSVHVNFLSIQLGRQACLSENIGPEVDFLIKCADRTEIEVCAIGFKSNPKFSFGAAIAENDHSKIQLRSVALVAFLICSICNSCDDVANVELTSVLRKEIANNAVVTHCVGF